MSGEIPLWAAWSEQSLLLSRGGADGIDRSELPRRTPPDLRYFIKLFRLAGGRLLLRSGSGSGTGMDVSAGGVAFQPIERWPAELARLPPYRVRATSSGTVAGIDTGANTMVLWSPSQPPRLRTPPSGFSLVDVDEDPPHLWISGSIPSRRLRSVERRAAFAVSTDGGISWEIDDRAHGGVLTAWRSVLSGAIGSYRSVHASAGNLLFTAATGDLGHETTFLFLRTPDGRWRSTTLQKDVVRAVLPVPGEGLRIVSHLGRMLQADRGAGWRTEQLRPPILRLLREAGAPGGADTRVEILDAQAANEQILAVASVRSPRRERLRRVGEAVVLLGAGRDRLVALHTADEPEVVTAAPSR